MKTRTMKRMWVLVMLIALAALCFSMQIFAGDLARGDMNGDGKVDSDDAIYLLRHTMLPDQYPLAVPDGCRHENLEVIDEASTCTVRGIRYEICTACYKLVNVYVYPLAEHVPAEAAACADTTCSVCGVWLSAPTAAHNIEVEEKAATCQTTGYRKEICKDCGKTVSSQTYPRTACAPAGEISCTEDSVCATCGRTIKAKGHDLIFHAGKPATYTEGGWKAYETCSKCDYSTYVELPILTPETDLVFVSNGDGTCYVSGIGGYLDSALVIPATSPDGDVVTGIGEYAFELCTTLVSVTIPDTVTSIGRDAFYDCTNLSAVYITDLAAWCDLVFETAKANPLYYAKNLYIDGEMATSITIPDGVTSINDYAFYNCDWLTGITISDSVINIGNSAFYDCDYLRNVAIPDSVTSMGAYVFYDCDRLTSVTIGDSVTSIGAYAFYNCDSLTSVTIPDSVTSIGDYVFYDCDGLKNITIPNSVTSIGSYAFYYCSGLTSMTIPDSIASIGDYAFFKCSNLTSVTIGNGVTSIGEGAFSNCSRLTSVYITDLAAWCGIAFENSAANPLYNGANLYLNGQVVTSLVIPDGVTSISSFAFYGCGSITSVTIPDSVTGIGNDAFYNCSRLRRVTIGNGVTSIGYYAFYNCSSLTSVTFSDTDTWYRTTSPSYLYGSVIDVTDATQNATYFKETYYGYYWYKK